MMKLFFSGTFYRPEKPIVYPEENHAQLQEILQNSSQRHTAPAHQTRPSPLPIPIVYH